MDQDQDNSPPLVNLREIEEIVGKDFRQHDGIKELFASILSECSENLNAIQSELDNFSGLKSIKTIRLSLHQLKGLSFVDRFRRSVSELHHLIHEYQNYIQQPDHNKKENQEYMNKIYAQFAAVQSIYSETKKEIEKNQLVN